ncbi:hypothetical protein [Tsukamurella sp. 1534]|uniref:hypothetical protein n=1 Tax=Tsukamurella sp. 1534 TaxID=1151061 RepID=UPI0011D1CE68|nr:hypothetical protein [Tsukamurella sp. 1534]
MADDLAAGVKNEFGESSPVSTRTRLVRLSQDYALDTRAARSLEREFPGMDTTVLITEMPRRTRGRPLLTEEDEDRRESAEV